MLARNFMSYGFLPELIGRFRSIVPFAALTREQLSRILRSTLLTQYVNEFLLEGKELVVSDQVLDKIVEESIRKETGARALEASFMRYLEDAAFEAFSEPSVAPRDPQRAGGPDCPRHLLISLTRTPRRACDATASWKTAARSFGLWRSRWPWDRASRAAPRTTTLAASSRSAFGSTPPR